MEKLPLTQKASGACRQITRSDDYVILERIPTNSTKTSYEVHVIAKNKEWQIAGKTIPAREALQPTSQFGAKAWTHLTLKSAFVRFEHLVENGLGGDE